MLKIIRKPAEMICYFTKEGIPNPIKFSIIGEDDSWVNIKVDRVITRDIDKRAGNRIYIFQCQSNINGIEKIYELRYVLENCKWELFKI
ncbi:conserved protein of unknown function [Tepidibacter aestuarii]|nr:conserved protein of unknown function [Tepidibacter aestuarii]